MEVSVVIPCLNEAKSIAICVDKARAAFAAAGVEPRAYGNALGAGIEAARGAFIVMDRIGSRPRSVSLPYNYQPGESWTRLFSDLGFRVIYCNQNVPLHPPPFSAVFGRRLH